MFRHALIALGEEPPEKRRAAAERLATVLGFDGAGFVAVLQLREMGQRAQVDLQATFGAYLEFVTRVAHEIDRRLSVKL